MLAKKGSRKIAINGNHYLWKASNKSGSLIVAIQDPSSNGQMLIAKIASDIWDMTEWERAVGPVTPKLVEKIIDLALTQGWQPKQKGTVLELECPMSFHHNPKDMWRLQ